MNAILRILCAAATVGALAGCVSNDADERALTGAAIGAPVGAIVGGVATGNPGGAAIGAGAGAVGGALIGVATTPPPDYYDVEHGHLPYPGYGYRSNGNYGPAYAYYDGHVVGPPSSLYRVPPRCLQEGYDPYGRVYCIRFDFPYDGPRH